MVTFGAEMVDPKYLRIIASLSEVKKLPAGQHNAAVLLRNCERRFCKPSLGLDISSKFGGHSTRLIHTPRKFNIDPENRPKPKRRLIFQPSFFRGYVKLRESNLLICHYVYDGYTWKISQYTGNISYDSYHLHHVPCHLLWSFMQKVRISWNLLATQQPSPPGWHYMCSRESHPKPSFTTVTGWKWIARI